MPGGDWTLTNYRVDARGHILAVEVRDFSVFVDPDYFEDRRWYDLDGTIIESSRVPAAVRPYTHDLRIDTRGHIVAVYYGLVFPLPHWYDLDATDLGEGGEVGGIINIRIDARGHVVAVNVGEANWYDLNGDVAA